MKVLFVTNLYPYEEYPYYGIFVKEQIEAITRLSNIEDKVFFIRGYKSKLEYLKSIFIINFLIMKWKPDIIHIHYGLSGLFLLFNPFVWKKTIITLHGSDANSINLQGFLTKNILKRVGFIFALNNTMLRKIIKLNKNIEILTCGVDMSFFICKNNKENAQEKLIVFPGNPERTVKNFTLFQQVLKDLKSKLPDIAIKFKEVHNLDRDGVRELLCSADCMIMTSLSEGSPQIIKEAMSCNLPIVSVDVGDVGVVLDGVKDCYVSKSYDINNLSRLAENILNKENVLTNGREKLSILNLDNAFIAKKNIQKYNNILEKSL